MNNKSCVIETKRIDNKEVFLNSFPFMVDGYVLVMATDKFELLNLSTHGIVTAEKEKWYENALEIRMFDKQVEYKWFRSSIDKSFFYRMIKDKSHMDEMDFWNEDQYLDINLSVSKKMSGDKVCATGGGVYSLPLPELQKSKNQEDKKENRNQKDESETIESHRERILEDVKIRIRNYLGYEEETGQLYISDWRLVEFLNKKEGGR